MMHFDAIVASLCCPVTEEAEGVSGDFANPEKVAVPMEVRRH
jgi:hypothetical protein